MKTVLGKDLKPGDTIEVWWRPKRDTITAIRPYAGRLNLPEGTQIADFLLSHAGMTIMGDEAFEVLFPGRN
jgi:hypothetical protein